MAKSRSKGSKADKRSSKAANEKEVPAASAKKIKAKTDADRRKSKIDGIKKTLMPAVLGVMGGFAISGMPDISANYPWHFVVLNFLLITLIIQRVIYPKIGIEVMEFKAKDWIYVEFIAIDLWLVTWTILIN
ncbi:MAG: hypothetical protein JW986_05400 [Methanotrichaceae archaeon]|nr:hypothetical protein [Methanotrichaceae archaeon]